MRKYNLLSVIVVILLFALAGCGSGSGKAPEASTGAEGQTSLADTAGQEATTQDDDAKAEDSGQASVTGRPQIGLSRTFIHETDKKNKKTYVDGDYDFIHIVGDDAGQYKDLSDTLEAAMKKKADELEKEKERCVKAYNNDDMAKEIAPNGYELNNKMYVRRADSQVLSIMEENSGYSGGVHGYFSYSADNYDAATGKKIALEDVVSDRDQLVKALTTELKKKYSEDSFFEDMADTIDKEIHEVKADGIDYDATWTLDPQGITFFFSPYDIGPWAAGPFSASILYDKADGIFTDKYRPKEGDGYVYAIPMDEKYSVDVDNDGRADDLLVTANRDDETEYMTNLEVSVNDQKLTIDEVDCFTMDPKLVLPGDGRAFLYTWCKGDNDYVNMYVVDLSSGKPVSAGMQNTDEAYIYPEKDVEYTEEIEAELPSLDTPYKLLVTDPSYMRMVSRIDILSTYDGEKTYQVGDSPVPETNDPYYTIMRKITLKSVKDIEAAAVDEEGNVSKENKTIPAGSSFILVRTDGKGFVDARLEDGSMVRIVVTEGYPQYINGVDANELFEQLYFAG